MVFALVLFFNQFGTVVGATLAASRQGFAFARDGGMFFNERCVLFCYLPWRRYQIIDHHIQTHIYQHQIQGSNQLTACAIRHQFYLGLCLLGFISRFQCSSRWYHGIRVAELWFVSRFHDDVYGLILTMLQLPLPQ